MSTLVFCFVCDQWTIFTRISGRSIWPDPSVARPEKCFGGETAEVTDGKIKWLSWFTKHLKKDDPFVSGQDSLYECSMDDNSYSALMSRTSEFVYRSLLFFSPLHANR